MFGNSNYIFSLFTIAYFTTLHRQTNATDYFYLNTPGGLEYRYSIEASISALK